MERILAVEVRSMDELRDYFLGGRARQYRRAFSRVGWALTLMLVLNLAGQLLLQFLVSLLAPGLLSQVDMLYLISGFSSYCIAAPAALLVLRTLPALPREAPPRSLTALQAVKLWLVCVGGSYLLNFATQWCMDWLARGRGAPFTDPVDQIGQMSLWVSLPLTCVLGPLVEELCFRRAVLERLRPYGDGFALCASAILFALFHGGQKTRLGVLPDDLQDIDDAGQVAEQGVIQFFIVGHNSFLRLIKINYISIIDFDSNNILLYSKNQVWLKI